MAWDLTGVRRGTLDEQGCDGLKVGADIRRAGPTWAAGQELAVGRQRYADSGHEHDRDNGIFQVTAPISFRVEAVQKRDRFSAPWNPRLHMIQSSVPVSSAALFQRG